MVYHGQAHHDDQDTLDYGRLAIEINGLELHRVRYGERPVPDYSGLATRVFHRFDAGAETLAALLQGKPIGENIAYLRGLHESHVGPFE